MSSTSTLGKGEWICSEDDCGNRNFSKRDKCNKCGVKKRDIPKAVIEIGKSVAEKSKGLFSADDWMCKSCGNINWARRNTCNICNTNKVNIQGQRTGFGGGFNEREEIVLYKERNDEDDEYDEFGMKKKKFRGTKANSEEMVDNNTQKVEVVKKSAVEDLKPIDADWDGDDSDVEDDDADLSKYDLWGDDVEATKPINNNVDKKLSSQSSSSSGSSSDSSDTSDSDSSSSSIRKDKSESRKRTKNSPRSRFAHHAFIEAVYN